MVKRIVFLDEELEGILNGEYEDFEKVHAFKWMYVGEGEEAGIATIKRISDGQYFEIDAVHDKHGTFICDYVRPITKN